jgi:N-acetylmuramoyl-L-alanine amidase
MRPIGQTVGACLRSARLPALKALGLAWALAACALAASPQIRAVRFWSLGDVTRVAIETDSEVQYHAERIDRPDRIFLDLAGVRRQAGTRGLQVIPVDDKLVKQIRIALVEAGTIRVVLDLAAPADYSISQLTDPDRIMIELRLSGHGPPMPPARSITGSHILAEPADPPTAQAPRPPPPVPDTPKAQPTPLPPLKVSPASALEPPAASGAGTEPRASAGGGASTEPRASASGRSPKRIDPPTVAKLEPVVTKAEPAALAPVTKPQPAPAATPEETALAAKRDSNGDRSLIRALGLKIDRVVIDPGHGGHDTGTIGPTGLMEKDLVLDVARRLGTLIAQRLASEVVYTRSDDTFIPLEERTRIANDKKADLFLSIHANSSQLPRIAGSETFYLNFTTSEDALEVAARENASSQTSIHELQTLVQKIALNEKVQESRELASILQKAMYANVPRNRSYKNRGIKKAPFVVLIGAQMPSVLAEIAFLSNPKDEGLLKKPEYRQKIAEALFRGIAQYADALSHLQVARQRQQDSPAQ